MANTVTTANMDLVLPIPTQELGPAWALELNAAFELIDAHDHSPGKGVLVTPLGLNINTDLAFNSSNATLLKSTRFSAQSVALSGSSDVGCVYVVGNELYYNDVTGGHQIAITASGSVTGSSGTITGLPSGTASAAFAAGNGTFTFLQATSTGANMDAATYILRYPGSYPTPSGNYIALQAPSSLATGFSFTLPANVPASSGAFLTSSTGGVLSYTNVDNSTLQITSSTLIVKSAGITGTQITSNINLPGNAVQENGNNIVVSMSNNTTSIGIARGTVSSAGVIVTGEGFSVSHAATGTYNITFSPNYPETPTVTASVIITPPARANYQLTSVASTGFTMLIYDLTNTLSDQSFCFIAMGKRS